jgi:hypothetical protein
MLNEVAQILCKRRRQPLVEDRWDRASYLWWDCSFVGNPRENGFRRQ